jgi:hypothetical protein
MDPCQSTTVPNTSNARTFGFVFIWRLFISLKKIAEDYSAGFLL